MKILFAGDISIANVIGGAERVLYEQSTRLSSHGHQVHIITRRLPDHDSDHEIINGVHEWRYRIDSRNTFLFLYSTWKNSRLIFETLHNKHKFECINFHQPFSSLGILSSFYSRNIRKIYTCHSLSFEEFISRNPKAFDFKGHFLHCLHTYFRKRIEGYALRSSDDILVLSRFTQDKLCSAYNIPKQKIKIIPGGVDLERFYPAENKKLIRNKHNIPSGKIVLFTVRNLVPRMGLENLIFAMKNVVKEIQDIYLVIGGYGPLREKLTGLAKKTGIEEHICFTGFIPEHELPDYFRMSDLFILPTLELEGFGMVTLESMASGVPVLGTPVGGTKEILGEFSPDLLFKDTEPESISKLILNKCREIRENSLKWNELSKKCRLFVEKNYSWDQNINSLEKVLGAGQNEL